MDKWIQDTFNKVKEGKIARVQYSHMVLVLQPENRSIGGIVEDSGGILTHVGFREAVNIMSHSTEKPQIILKSANAFNTSKYIIAIACVLLMIVVGIVSGAFIGIAEHVLSKLGVPYAWVIADGIFVALFFKVLFWTSDKLWQ